MMVARCEQQSMIERERMKPIDTCAIMHMFTGGNNQHHLPAILVLRATRRARRRNRPSPAGETAGAPMA
jgi:hypothetical protein